LIENGYHASAEFDENLVQIYTVDGVEIEYPANNDLQWIAGRVEDITRSVLETTKISVDYRPAPPNLPAKDRTFIIRIARSVVLE